MRGLNLCVIQSRRSSWRFFNHFYFVFFWHRNMEVLSTTFGRCSYVVTTTTNVFESKKIAFGSRIQESFVNEHPSIIREDHDGSTGSEPITRPLLPVIVNRFSVLFRSVWKYFVSLRIEFVAALSTKHDSSSPVSIGPYTFYSKENIWLIQKHYL
jgi:hypothetical protein